MVLPSLILMIVLKSQNVVSISTVFGLARPRPPSLHRQNLGHSIDHQVTLAEVIIVFEILLEFINLWVDVGVFLKFEKPLCVET